MKKLKLSQKWLMKVLPEGLPYPSTLLISGPGGSGKPLIGFAFVYDWLKAGGNVIFAPLQYPKIDIVKTSLKQLYNLDIEQYSNQAAYIQFNPELDKYKMIDENTVEANLLKPDVLDEAIKAAEGTLTESKDLGTLIFASALNLLLFSPTYKQLNLDKIERLIKENKTKTYLFSVSTSAFREEIRRWEQAADNLMFARMQGPMKLYLKTTKIENRKSLSEEIQVPISKKMLENIKEVAESTRQRQIPKLRKI
jgi:archaellum biogenesis ATPase FlaH